MCMASLNRTNMSERKRSSELEERETIIHHTTLYVRSKQCDFLFIVVRNVEYIVNLIICLSRYKMTRIVVVVYMLHRQCMHTGQCFFSYKS